MVLALCAFLFVRALSTADSPPAWSARWLLARVGLAAVLVLFSVATLNHLVNPVEIYSTRLFEPLVLRSRTDKMQLYRAAQPPHEIVGLGSSSSVTMSPVYICEGRGRPSFIASLHGGVPKDYLAFLRSMAPPDKLPKLLIIPMSAECPF